MALETTDPFTLIYQRIWTALTGYAPWANTVKAGNRMRFDEAAYPGKLDLNLQPGDAPLVALLQAEFPIDPFKFDTSASDMTLNFPLVVLGSNLKVIPVNQVKWATLRAIVNAGFYLGLPRLVRGVRIVGARDDLLNPDKWKQGHNRMMAMLTIAVNCTIKNDQVLAGEYEATL